jgi:hypothetical protein
VPRAGGTGLPAKPGSAAAAAGGRAFHTAVAEQSAELRHELDALVKELKGGEAIEATMQQYRERMDDARNSLKKVRETHARRARAHTSTRSNGGVRVRVRALSGASPTLPPPPPLMTVPCVPLVLPPSHVPACRRAPPRSRRSPTPPARPPARR